MVPLKCLSNVWKTLGMPLNNCEIYLMPTWSANSVILCNVVAAQARRSEITGTKRYIRVVTLSVVTKAASSIKIRY